MGRLLGRALEAARKALRDVNTKEMPPALRARLQKVRAHSGALTPPLVKVLVTALADDEWLRAKALEAWPEADSSVGAPDRGSALFLRRPAGWELDFASLAGDEGAASSLKQVERTAAELAEVKSNLGAVKEKLSKSEARLKQSEARVQALDKRLSDPIRTERKETNREIESLEKERSRWEVDRSALAAKLAAAQVMSAALTEDTRRLRAERAEAERRLSEVTGGSTWWTRAPVDLASFLDDAAAQARVPTDSEMSQGAAKTVGFSLSVGVRADAADAVTALIGFRGAMRVVVDGYNVSLLVAEGARGRERVASWIRALLRLTSPPVMATIVWDSALGSGDTITQGRLETRFTEAGTIADDVIVSIVASSEVDVVVITNDKQLQTRCVEAGATVLYSDALVAWAATTR